MVGEPSSKEMLQKQKFWGKIWKARLALFYRRKKRQFLESRFLLGLLMLLIGISYTTDGFELYALGFRGIYLDKKVVVIDLSHEEIGVADTSALVPVAHASSEQADSHEEEKVLRPITPQSAQEITKIVYELETNSGKNPNNTDQGCHQKGLHNGYGFIPGSCYKSDEATGKLVEKWFESQLKTKTAAQALCLYNTGNPLSDCKYYQNYLRIYEKELVQRP